MQSSTANYWAQLLSPVEAREEGLYEQGVWGLD